MSGFVNSPNYNLLLTLLMLVCIIACSVRNESAVKEPTIQTIRLSNGEQQSVDSSLEMKFVKVLGDSRCPVDVSCIHAGEATILISVIKNGEKIGTHRLTALNQDSAVTYIEGRRLKLEELKPRPVSTKEIQPDDYVAVFKLEE